MWGVKHRRSFTMTSNNQMKEYLIREHRSSRSTVLYQTLRSKARAVNTIIRKKLAKVRTGSLSPGFLRQCNGISHKLLR